MNTTNTNKCTNEFKSLNDKEERLLSTSLMGFIIYVKKNEMVFKNYFAIKYRKFNIETLINYYFNNVFKNKEVEEITNNCSMELIFDIRNFIDKYYNHKWAILYRICNSRNDMDNTIKVFFDTYQDLKEVTSIKSYLANHYSKFKEIPEDYKIRIIKKLETTIYLKECPSGILELVS
ncbi:hypothetical protein [Clostridium sp.]|jgi:hypothetical protein|uniref:hypothetical protein n=1 Tax=Clostridium sp. TaxID=1506 RepID=UPI00258870E1|nr:hypothetical protein [Clostridium sp.]MDF2503075.1 hypothetical protein [Clostridium sp.]